MGDLREGVRKGWCEEGRVGQRAGVCERDTETERERERESVFVSLFVYLLFVSLS